MRRGALRLANVAGIALALGGTDCRDLSSFSTGGDRFEGPVVSGDFVRAGVADQTHLCLSLDADHFQDGPGLLATDDARFASAPLRPIPELWRDPLSTLSFGEGRLRNLIYVVTATEPFNDGNGDDVLAVISLMQSGDVEVRLLRGAPPLGPNDGGAGGNLFAIFVLSRQKGPCSY